MRAKHESESPVARPRSALVSPNMSRSRRSLSAKDGRSSGIQDHHSLAEIETFRGYLVVVSVPRQKFRQRGTRSSGRALLWVRPPNDLAISREAPGRHDTRNGPQVRKPTAHGQRARRDNSRTYPDTHEQRAINGWSECGRSGGEGRVRWGDGSIRPRANG